MIIAIVTAQKCAAVNTKHLFHGGGSWFLVCDLVADTEPQTQWSQTVPQQFSIRLHLLFVYRNKTVLPFKKKNLWKHGIPEDTAGSINHLNGRIMITSTCLVYRAVERKTLETRVMAWKITQTENLYLWQHAAQTYLCSDSVSDVADTCWWRGEQDDMLLDTSPPITVWVNRQNECESATKTQII